MYCTHVSGLPPRRCKSFQTECLNTTPHPGGLEQHNQIVKHQGGRAVAIGRARAKNSRRHVRTPTLTIHPHSPCVVAPPLVRPGGASAKGPRTVHLWPSNQSSFSQAASAQHQPTGLAGRHPRQSLPASDVPICTLYPSGGSKLKEAEATPGGPTSRRTW
jgi:hypothetical protein